MTTTEANLQILTEHQVKLQEKKKQAQSISNAIKGYIKLTDFITSGESKMNEEDIQDLQEYIRERLIEHCSQLDIISSTNTEEDLHLKDVLYQYNYPLDMNPKDSEKFNETSNEIKNTFNFLVDLMVTGILMEKELRKNEDFLETISKCKNTFNLFKQPAE